MVHDFLIENWIKILFISFIVLSIVVTFCKKTIKESISAEYYGYIFLLTATTIFVIINWNDCVNMQFFSSFNGYNIIFLLWITLLLFLVVKIDFNGITSFNQKKKADNEFEVALRENEIIKKTIEATLKENEPMKKTMAE